MFLRDDSDGLVQKKKSTYIKPLPTFDGLEALPKKASIDEELSSLKPHSIELLNRGVWVYDKETNTLSGYFSKFSRADGCRILLGWEPEQLQDKSAIKIPQKLFLISKQYSAEEASVKIAELKEKGVVVHDNLDATAAKELAIKELGEKYSAEDKKLDQSRWR